MQLLLKGLCKFLDGVWSFLCAWTVSWRCPACLLVAVAFAILVFFEFSRALEMAWRWAFGRGMKSCCMEGGKPGLQNKRSWWVSNVKAKHTGQILSATEWSPNNGAKWRTFPRLFCLSFYMHEIYTAKLLPRGSSRYFFLLLLFLSI